ncbi:MAG TPA: hypothetical protein VD731_02565 [Nitrosopumilaceae archaeon]|nr:hypothetical protein [Nitrosopumilaceae archaeon]
MMLFKPVIILGVIVGISGLVFQLQGRSIIGPESSFMYSNPEWITLGQQIMVIGILMIVAGLIIKLKSK